MALTAPSCRASARLTPGAAQPDLEPPWERDNPVRPLPTPPPGLDVDLSQANVKISPEEVRLGRWLFFDGRLSRDGTVSCATCHRPAHAFSEPTAHSTGIGGRQGTRKAPPILNAAFPLFDVYFWDGRARSLAEQAKGPITNPVEMGNTLDGVVRTISAIPGYRRAFREVFGDDRIDIDRVAEAIAAYEATRLSGGSAYDRFAAGDEGALTPLAREGFELFFGRGRCSACHLGPSLTDSRFHNVGIGYDSTRWRALDWSAPTGAPRPTLVEHGFHDPGRFAVTGAPADVGAFKTPTLRDVSRHAPYMHDGSSPTLEDAVSRYVDVESNPWLDPAMREAQLTPADIPPLVAFLRALDGTGFEDSAPRTFPR
jgi:cytochrome c peroxidase